MKLNQPCTRCRYATGAIGCIIVATTIYASAASYSVNFLGNTTDNVTAAAGVLGNTGWNNVGASFSGSITSSDGGSTATLNVSGPSAGGAWHSGIAADAGNGGLLSGYMDVTNNGGATITISGIGDGQYDVYFYTYGDDPRPQNNGDYLPNYTVQGTNYYTGVLGNNSSTNYTSDGPTPVGFSGFVQASPFTTNTNAQVPLSTFGNYLKVSSVTVSGGQIVLGAGLNSVPTSSWRSALNGIEIVSVPEPSTTLISMLGGLFGFGFVRRRR